MPLPTWAGVLQVLYLLDVASQAMITIARAHTWLHASFSRDSKYIVVELGHDPTRWFSGAANEDQHFDVYLRNGRKAARLQAPRDTYKRGFVCTSSSTVVALHLSGWRVWDLATGYLIASKTLCAELQATLRPKTLKCIAMAANRPGTKLAFFSSCSLVLQLFDAGTLEPLGRVYPALGMRFVPAASPISRLVWASSSSWVVMSSTHLGAGAYPSLNLCHHLQVLTLQPNAGRYNMVLCCPREDSHYPAVSPDGAFVCTRVMGTHPDDEVAIYSTQSGQLMLMQPTQLPGRDCYCQGYKPDFMFGLQADLWWCHSDSGHRVLAKAQNIESDGSRRVGLQVLQLARLNKNRLK